MPARILVVDDVPTNRLMLRLKLAAKYFDVLEAADGETALRLAREEQPDLILLDVMMPGIDGIETCRRLRAAEETHHIPVMMLTGLDRPEDRVRGLEAGADDFLSKPMDDVALFARVNGIVRMKTMIDELRLRGDTARALELADDWHREPPCFADASVLVVGADGEDGLVAGIPAMRRSLGAAIEHAEGERAMQALIKSYDFDCIVIGHRPSDGDPIRIASLLRARPQTRRIPLLLIFDREASRSAHVALEMGVADYLVHPIDPSELVARVQVQLRRKAYSDRLRAVVNETMALAVTDPLTGLHNRRYASAHLRSLLAKAEEEGKPLAVLMLDLDDFKVINDRHGHAAGDAVLKAFSRRLADSVRAGDLIARMGGEEFLIAMPGSSLDAARDVAERIRSSVEHRPIDLPGGGRARITVSIGLAARIERDDAKALMMRADDALYMSKRKGRNLVTLSEVAA